MCPSDFPSALLLSTAAGLHPLPPVLLSVLYNLLLNFIPWFKNVGFCSCTTHTHSLLPFDNIHTSLQYIVVRLSFYQRGTYTDLIPVVLLLSSLSLPPCIWIFITSLSLCLLLLPSFLAITGMFSPRAAGPQGQILTGAPGEPDNGRSCSVHRSLLGAAK